jgi:hypothetical protein
MIPSQAVCAVAVQSASPKFHRALRNGGRPHEMSWSLHSLNKGCAFAAASGFDEVTEFGYLSSHSVGLVPSDENRLVHDSIGDGTCCGFEGGSAALYATMDDSNVIIYVSLGNSAPVMSATKSMRNMLVSRITTVSQTQPGRQSCSARAARS